MRPPLQTHQGNAGEPISNTSSTCRAHALYTREGFNHTQPKASRPSDQPCKPRTIARLSGFISALNVSFTATRTNNNGAVHLDLPHFATASALVSCCCTRGAGCEKHIKTPQQLLYTPTVRQNDPSTQNQRKVTLNMARACRKGLESSIRRRDNVSSAPLCHTTTNQTD